MTSTCPSSSILQWLLDSLEGLCLFPREDLKRDCEEILGEKFINPNDPVERFEDKDEILKRLNQWQRDKEFLGSLDVHIILARHLRKRSRVGRGCDFLDAWKHENVRLNRKAAKALSNELQSVVRETLRKKAPSRTEGSDKFAAELCLKSLEYFHNGLEKLIGYPSLNVDPMKAMKAEHEHGKPFYNKKNRHVHPSKEWNFVVWRDPIEIGEVACGPEIPIRNRDITHDIDHSVREAETKFKDANLNRAEITALRLWTGPMHSRYSRLIQEYSNAEGNSRDSETDAGYVFSVREGGYVNTLHAINSGITKLARVWKVPRDRKVFRGYDNVKMQQLKRDQFGCIGGVESSFLATSEKDEVAVSYSGEGAFILEFNVGQVNKGADISWVSQFPDEKEILFNALSSVEFLGSPELRFIDGKGTIEVYRVQISSNTRSRTLDEFGNLRKSLHSNMVEVLLTQAHREISERAEMSANKLIKDLCSRCKEHSKTIFESAKTTEASVFNDGNPEYLRLVKEVITFQELSLTLLKLASDWFTEETVQSAHLDYMKTMQNWQFDSLLAAFRDNERPRVTKIFLENRSEIFATSIFDAERVNLGQVSLKTIFAVGKLLSLNPGLTALYLKADLATADVWGDVFKDFQTRKSGFTINEFEIARYAIPSLRRLEIRHAQDDMVKMMVPALQYRPPPFLTRLSLFNCPMGCAGAESLARSFECLKSLTVLGLGKCKVGDTGCAALAQNLSELNRLEEIDLSHNIIGRQALLLLAEKSTLTSLNQLKYVDVRYNVDELRPSQLEDSSRIRTNIIEDLRFDSGVLRVAWSPNGSKVAAAFHKCIIILDASTRTQITQLSCALDLSGACFLCMAWSSDGCMIASGSSVNTVVIWDALTGDKKNQLEGHTRSVNSVAWSPEGSMIASGSSDDTIIIWDTVTGKQKTQLEGKSGSIWSVAWSPQGSKSLLGPTRT